MFSGTPIEYDDEPLKNEDFWPDLNLQEFQEQRSIPADIDAGTVATALLTAAGEVNDLLVSVRDKYQAKGIGQASEAPGISMMDGNLLCARYKRAVYARAKADLMGEFASIGRRETHPGQESEETRNSLLSEGSIAIRAIKGKRRVGVRKI
ncbi:head completion/stabilization protein [Ewingella americana]|uniref:Head completion/stabilization protein n=1 Tax=Ewingella americana TaxID=41202 RepID=A0A502GKJ7_9GAMM|nr:head completion/stabilization protein [Ewingella americana]TPG61506.1 head completion/stabilization protein [Ewingella americana]